MSEPVKTTVRIVAVMLNKAEDFCLLKNVGENGEVSYTLPAEELPFKTPPWDFALTLASQLFEIDDSCIGTIANLRTTTIDCEDGSRQINFYTEIPITAYVKPLFRGQSIATSVVWVKEIDLKRYLEKEISRELFTFIDMQIEDPDYEFVISYGIEGEEDSDDS